MASASWRYRRRVGARFEHDGPDSPWSGRRPRYDRLACDGTHFFLDARLPSGKPVRCKLEPIAAPADLREMMVVREQPSRRGLLARLRNPRSHVCACLPECWCRRSRLGNALRWHVPARWHHLPPSPAR
jgi:hypothetical protein